MAVMDGLRCNFYALRMKIKGGTEDTTDQRRVGDSEYYTNRLLEAIEESCIRMKYLVASGGSSNGTLL